MRATSPLLSLFTACLLALGPLSCGHLGRGGGDDSEARLAQVDALLHHREDPAQLDEALVALDELMFELGDDPQLLARLSLAHYARGYGHAEPEPPPLRYFEAGREAAWRCIYQDPSFQGVLTSTGGVIGPPAAARIGEEHSRCLVWLVANWSRWLASRDPAGFAIDLQPLQVLSDRAVEISTGSRRATALGTAAMSRALAPEAFGPDPEQARVLFLRAIEIDPGNLSLQVDLAQYVYGPLDDEISFRSTLEGVLATPPETGGRWLLENRRAHARAQALLSPE
jgi:hypothetical protein